MLAWFAQGQGGPDQRNSQISGAKLQSLGHLSSPIPFRFVPDHCRKKERHRSQKSMVPSRKLPKFAALSLSTVSDVALKLLARWRAQVPGAFQSCNGPTTNRPALRSTACRAKGCTTKGTLRRVHTCGLPHEPALRQALTVPALREMALMLGRSLSVPDVYVHAGEHVRRSLRVGLASVGEGRRL